MKKITLAGWLLFVCLTSSAQLIKSGQWRGVIYYSDSEVSFNFEVSYPAGETPIFTFINGSERRTISDVSIQNDTLYIAFTPFDVQIKAVFTAMSMEGFYHKRYRGSSYRFSAEFGKPRMMKKSVRPSPEIPDRLEMVFEEGTLGEYKGVGLFRQVGSIVTGTVMTKVSDYRYFEGIIDGDSMKLSCFDGAHAFKIIGKKSGEEWIGEMIYDEGYRETWRGIPNEKVELEDPFEIVKLEKGVHKPYLDLLSAGSGRNALDPADFEGKVLIIQLFGTWCPNSHDQTKFLVDWHAKNKAKEVAIVASSYEANYSKEYGMRRLEEYRIANDIPYQLVLGGRLSKTAAALPFPFMKRIEAFPTLVIVDKEGYARYVHSYFNGPATETYYSKFIKKFNEIIDELSNE